MFTSFEHVAVAPDIDFVAPHFYFSEFSRHAVWLMLAIPTFREECAPNYPTAAFKRVSAMIGLL